MIDKEYIKKVMNAIEVIKKKISVLQYIQRLYGAQKSPYYYINKERLKLWKIIKKPKNRLSPF